MTPNVMCYGQNPLEYLASTVLRTLIISSPYISFLEVKNLS